MSSGESHHKSSHKVLDKISSKFSALKEDITEAVKERSHSTTSDHRRNSMSSNQSPTNNDHVIFTLQDDISSETKQTFSGYGM
jgi:hypothetical protein